MLLVPSIQLHGNEYCVFLPVSHDGNQVGRQLLPVKINFGGIGYPFEAFALGNSDIVASPACVQGIAEFLFIGS